MSKFPQRRLLFIAAALLLMAVTVPAAVAAESVAVSGSFHGKGDAVEEVTLHPDGTGEVIGEIHFVGCVTDRCGSAEILFEGTLPNPEVANGTFTVVRGTGGLAGIRGRGEFLQAPDGTYSGAVRF